jgi:hypothetical protein
MIFFYKMPTIIELYDKFPDNYVLNRYIQCSKESWCLDHFYLGGQLKLHINDDITTDHIKQVKNINEQPFSPDNSWEHDSIMRSLTQFTYFCQVYEEYLKKIFI